VSLAPFVPSPPYVVEKMLRLADLKPEEVLFDLGCGDGRIIIAAAQKYGVRAVGVEMSESLAKEAVQKVHELGLEKSVRVIQRDLMGVDLKEADVVMLYLTSSGNEKLKPKLERELKPGARVISHDFEVYGWKPLRVEKIADEKHPWPTRHKIYIYKVQNKL
jgi:cyclopropane fatty-acyl-phospholipid synthase-like methyltransferase